MKKIIRITLSVILVMVMLITALGFTSVPVKSIKLDKSKITLSVGQTYALKATITPADAGNKNLSFATSDKKIAAVDKKGKITALKAGKAIITVSSYDKKVSAKCDVTVSQKGAAGESGEIKYPIVKNKITLKVMWPSSVYHIDDFSKYTLVKAWEDITNIHFDFITPKEGFAEKLNLAFQTGDLPDIFIASMGFATADKYGKTGDLIALNDLIQYAPHLKKKMSQYPLMAKSMRGLDGKIYSLGMLNLCPTTGSFKVLINIEWLKNLNLQVPKTVDEFYNMLKAFKEKDPNKNGKQDEIPMITIKDMTFTRNTILPWFGQTGGDAEGGLFNTIGGKVNFIPYAKGYREYLQYMNKLFKNKLLDNNFLSQSEEERVAKYEKNILGAVLPFSGGKFENWAVLAPLTSPVNSRQMSTPPRRVGGGGGFVITRVNKYPVESMKWADMFYRDWEEAIDGISGICLDFGKQGLHWDFVDREKKTWNYIFDVPEGESSWLYYLKHHGPGGMGFGNLDYMDLVADDPYQAWVADQNLKDNIPYWHDDWMLPSALRYTDEVLDRKNILLTDITTYINQMESKFIVGEESFSNWDTYMKTLKDMGADELVKIVSDSYNKFMKN